MKAGVQSLCEHCGERIVFTGEAWRHDVSNPSHTAEPRTLFDAPMIIDETLKTPKMSFGNLSAYDDFHGLIVNNPTLSEQEREEFMKSWREVGKDVVSKPILLQEGMTFIPAPSVFIVTRGRTPEEKKIVRVFRSKERAKEFKERDEFDLGEGTDIAEWFVEDADETVELKPQHTKMKVGIFECDLNEAGYGDVRIDGKELPITSIVLKVGVDLDPSVTITFLPVKLGEKTNERT